MMGFKSLAAKTIFAFAVLDLIFNPLVIASYLELLGIGMSQPAVPVMAVLLVIKIVACTTYIRGQLLDYEAYASMSSANQTVDLLLRADKSLQDVVTRAGVFYASSWSLVYGLGYLLLQTPLGRGIYFNSGSAVVVVLVVVAVWLGSFAFGMPLLVMLTATASGECSSRARELGVALPRLPETLQMRIGAVALCLVLGPVAYSISLGYSKQVEVQEQQNRSQAEFLVLRIVDHFDAKELPSNARDVLVGIEANVKGSNIAVLDRQGRSLVAQVDSDADTPSYGREVAERARNAASGIIRTSGRAERIAYQKMTTGNIAVARVDLPANSGGYVLAAVLFALVMVIWGPVCSIILGRAITNPVERLIAATERIVEEGKQSQMSALPVVRNDEVARLSARYNDLLEMMRDLSRAADAIASGELGIEVTRKGELPDAFRRMLESLRGMVKEIRGTSVDLASAATEILAASQEQESAATSQSSAMEEISRTMESLSASAAHVSDSVQGVLANAEQTLSTTDQMVARISELSGHANRIGEILDVIREIADRSDLLALNGSLEASRAGESGHGFALVAAEMRRLAERVTASVEDVKKLVSDIRDSGSSTVAATEEGRRLADGTTEAARQITFVTQQQRSGTEQVSESIRNITDVVTQAVSATAQTRTSAQGLKSQADRLAALVRKFEIGPSEAA